MFCRKRSRVDSESRSEFILAFYMLENCLFYHALVCHFKKFAANSVRIFGKVYESEKKFSAFNHVNRRQLGGKDHNVCITACMKVSDILSAKQLCRDPCCACGSFFKRDPFIYKH